MRILIDTCVIIDVLQNREPFCRDAQQIFVAAANNQFVGFITAKSVTDIYYITHRAVHDDKKTRKILNTLFCLFGILDTMGLDCRRAVSSDITDYEDAVMNETALREEVDYIVTRNHKDYINSTVSIISPSEMLKFLNGV